MIKNIRPPEDGVDEKVARTVRSQMRKRDFARRVNKARNAKGWTQAELGRKAGLPRYTINSYVQGVSLPEPQNLYQLAEALGVAPEELLPPEGEPADVLETLKGQFAPPALREIAILSGGKARLRVNQIVRAATGMRIMEILNDDEASDRSGSGGNSAEQHDQD